jgi:cytochrome P450
MATAAAAAKACPFSDASIDFHPFDVADPFPFYEWARQEAPVFFSPELNYFVVARYADIKAVFEDWRTFSSENAQAPLRPFGEEARRIMREGGFTAYSGLSARVPPDHTRIRKIVQRCFGVRRFRAIEPQIRQIVTQAIDAIIHDGEADLFREFAYDVPALVLFKLVGVPDGDVPKVKAWGASRSLLTWGNLSDQQQVPHAINMVEYWRYCQDIVRQRRESAGDDLPSDLLHEKNSGEDISDDEIAGVLYSALFAGHETTTTLMGNGLRELLLHRDNWEALVADPSLIPGAVDEILRYAPSLPGAARPCRIRRSAACRCRKTPTFCCCSGPPTAMRQCLSIRSVSTFIVTTPASTSPSVMEFTRVSVSNLRRSSSRSRWRS